MPSRRPPFSRSTAFQIEVLHLHISLLLITASLCGSASADFSEAVLDQGRDTWDNMWRLPVNFVTLHCMYLSGLIGNGAVFCVLDLAADGWIGLHGTRLTV